MLRILIRGALFGAVGAVVCTVVFGVFGYYAFIIGLASWIIYKLIKQSN